MIDINNIPIHTIGIENNTSRVNKLWGEEFILPGEGYTTKIMSVIPGSSCSLHFHRNKNETFILVEGILEIKTYTKDGTLHEFTMNKSLESIIIPKCTPHSFCVPNTQEFNTVFIESSTPDDPFDSYRLSKSRSSDSANSNRGSTDRQDGIGNNKTS